MWVLIIVQRLLNPGTACASCAGCPCESHEAGEIWCSPEYLRLKQSQGEYVWAPEHWELRTPLGYLNNLRAQAEDVVKEFNNLASRLGHDKALKLSDVAGSPNGEVNG